MTQTAAPLIVTDYQETQAAGLSERLFLAGLASFELYSVHLGLELGLYRCLVETGPCPPEALAGVAGIHERYAREWLEQQAVAGIIEFDDPETDATETDATERVYRLPPGHAEALLDPESLSYAAPFTSFLLCVPPALPALVEAFRTGGGVHHSHYDPYHREGQGAFNRAAFMKLLATRWLPEGAPDVDRRLGADPPARVADLGCGLGWSSIALARHYPKVRVDGFDFDAPSVVAARRNAEQAGVADRASFEVRDATDPALAGAYDLVVMFEVLHDLSRPVEVLRAAGRMLTPGGALIVMDERVAETFTAPGDEVERFMYACSVLHCLPTGMLEQPSAGTGTVLRPATVRHYAAEAGYSGVEVLPIAHDFFRFYRLVP